MSHKLKNIILIPTDFSEVCENAAKHGAEIARFLGYKVLLLHVINKESRSFLYKNDFPASYIEERLHSLASEILSSYKVESEIMVTEGSIFSSIPETAALVGANLIMLGTHGKTGFQYLTGSFALKVVLRAPVPVIVVQNRPFAQGYKNIVFPISEILEARQKVQWAAHLAQNFKATVHIFQELERDTALASRVNIITSQIKEEFEKKNITYTINRAKKPGNFAEQVLEFGTSSLADLIMIMTEPEIAEPEFSFKPWNERLMFNTSQIPVMCINPLSLSKYYFPF